MPFALQRLDPGGDDVAGDLEVDRAALGPQLVALFQQAVGLVEIASLVEQFAQRRARQPGGVGMTAAGSLGDLERLAEAGFRGRDVEHQPVCEARVAEAMNDVESVAVAFGVWCRPRLDPVHFVEVVVVRSGEGRHSGGDAYGERALAIPSLQTW